VSNATQTVSLYTATAMVVGSMVGTGVFTSLGFQVAETHSGFALLMLWLVGGVFALCGALCYAELAAALPRSGGEYHLLSTAFHPAAGFLSGWVSSTVGFAAPVALSAMAFGEYLGNAWPVLPVRALSVGIVLVAAFFHLFRIEIGSAFLDFFTTLKVVLIAAVTAVIFTVGDSQGLSFAPAAGDGRVLMSGAFAVSLVYVMYAYTGWNATVYIVNEVREPQKLVPRSLLLGTAIVTLLYIGLNAAFLYSTPIASMRGEVEVGLVVGRQVFGETGGKLMAGLIALGLVSMISAMTWTGPRVTEMMGEDYRLLRLFARTNRAGIPHVAILWQTLIVLVLLVTATFEFALVYIELLLTLSSLATVAAVVYLRHTRPDLPRPFRTPCYPWVPLAFLAMSIMVLVHVVRERPSESLWGLATLLLGLGLYALSRGTPRVRPCS
jgi:APA family basic amino acid/polyamine antiporter